ncbi:MAG: DUF2188 domain-containing protein [Hyphomicrobiaceae bacterium]
MQALDVYELQLDAKGQWQLMRTGAKRASKKFGTKAEAVANSKQFVKGKGKSQLIIRKADGAVQSEHTYA